MVETELAGVVLGLVACTLIGLFISAFFQFQRGNQMLTEI